MTCVLCTARINLPSLLFIKVIQVAFGLYYSKGLALFPSSFQSFLSIDCGKTAHMILTEFPDTLTIVIRQLEVRTSLFLRTVNTFLEIGSGIKVLRRLIADCDFVYYLNSANLK